MPEVVTRTTEQVLCSNNDICHLLGVTPEKGTCQRHPNIVIYKQKTVDNGGLEVLCCTVCDSELRAGGRKQRKTFANLIHDIQGMHNTDEWADYKAMTWGEEQVTMEDPNKKDIRCSIGVVVDDDGVLNDDEDNQRQGDNEKIGTGIRLSQFNPEQAFEAWSGGEQPKEGTAKHGAGLEIVLEGDESKERGSSSFMMELGKQQQQQEQANKTPSTAHQLHQEQRDLLKEEFKNYVEISDRHYRMKTYKKCFIAKEAIDFMVSGGYVESREEGVRLGKTLQRTFKIFDHVNHDHDFADDYLFFRFYDDSENGKDNNDMQITSNKLSQEQLEELAIKFKANAVVKDRIHHFKPYAKCFIAKEAVDFMVDLGYAKSRIEAVKIGKSLQVYTGLFEHVKQDRLFEDKHWLFRFIDNSKNWPSKKVSSSATAKTASMSTTSTMMSNIEFNLEEKPPPANVAEAGDSPTKLTIDEDFMIAIAKRAAQVQAWKKVSAEVLDTWGDRDHIIRQQASLSPQQRESNLAKNIATIVEEDNGELVESLKKELRDAKADAESKDCEIDELESKIARQERQIISGLRLIASEKRAEAKEKKELFLTGGPDPGAPLPEQFIQTEAGTMIVNPNDIAAIQVDKVKLDFASAQELASQRESSLKATIRTQTAALDDLQFKYNQQQEEMEKLRLGGGGGGNSSGSFSPKGAYYTSNPNLVNQIEKLKRENKTQKEEFSKKEIEYKSLIDEYVQKEKEAAVAISASRDKKHKKSRHDDAPNSRRKPSSPSSKDRKTRRSKSPQPNSSSKKPSSADRHRSKSPKPSSSSKERKTRKSKSPRPNSSSKKSSSTERRRSKSPKPSSSSGQRKRSKSPKNDASKEPSSPSTPSERRESPHRAPKGEETRTPSKKPSRESVGLIAPLRPSVDRTGKSESVGLLQIPSSPSTTEKPKVENGRRPR